MIGKISKLSIGVRFALIASALVLISFGALSLIVSVTMTHYLDEQTMGDLTLANRQVQELIQVFDDATEQDVTRLARSFTSYFPQRIGVERGKTVSVGGMDVPMLRSGSERIGLSNRSVDEFTARSGAGAAVFARMGREFVQVASSLKNEAGQRPLGSVLDHQHPGYRRLIEGNSYRGPAVLHGRSYMTNYEPLRDESGQVIGALFVGLDISNDVALLKSKIRSMRLRRTGFFYVLDARPGAGQGNALIHPSAEGTSLLGLRDAKGNEFVKEMMERRQGTLRYRAIPGGERKDGGEQVAAFSYMAAWDWLIVSETPAAEVFEVSSILRNELYAAAVLMALVLSGSLYIALKRTFGRRVTQAVGYARRVAAGDLAARTRMNYTDETGQLFGALDHMADSLSDLVSNVRQAAEQIDHTSKQIRSGNSELSQRTEQQASSLEETAASVEQLTGTVRQNSDNAKTANELAQRASGIAARGGQMVSQVVSTMSEIDASSKKIADIVTVIDGIAFQTNILALNAAVEAARAGEQGRGFAVVAAEVRNLAQRSADSAKEIKELIYESVDCVSNGSELVDETGRTMNEIVAAVKQVSELMADIADASVQQSAGIQEINQTMSLMEQVTQQNAAVVEEATASAEQLRSLAEQLVSAVSVFKVNPVAARIETGPTKAPSSTERFLVRPRQANAGAPVPASQIAFPQSRDAEWEEF
jgi:methyl-accepting chemotaxis protein-2 (aspartate sensor receptor)